MKKPTHYLPDQLKHRVEEVALQEGRSEANVIRDAIAARVAQHASAPRVPMPGVRLGDPSIAERVADLMDGFGQ